MAGLIPRRLVRFGGGDNAGQSVDSIGYLEEGATEWKTAGLKMKCRIGHAVVPIGSNVFIFGGVDGRQIHRSVHRFDLTGLTWTECANVSIASLRNPLKVGLLGSAWVGLGVS